MFFGLTIAQWITIAEAAPGIIAAVEKISPEVAQLVSTVEKVVQTGQVPDSPAVPAEAQEPIDGLGDFIATLHAQYGNAS